MASKIFFSHRKVYFWISAFDHRAIVLDKMHIVQCIEWMLGVFPAPALGRQLIYFVNTWLRVNDNDSDNNDQDTFYRLLRDPTSS